MKCPYCNKVIKDMVGHLKKSEKCMSVHSKGVLKQLEDIFFNSKNDKK